jgi:hypothetical protein
MSAYALPGLVFPPLPGSSPASTIITQPPLRRSFSCPEVQTSSTIRQCHNNCDDTDSTSSVHHFDGPAAAKEAANHRHQFASTASPSSTIFGRYFGSSPFVMPNNNSDEAVMDQNQCDSEESKDHNNREVTVVVKGARVDILQLINSTFSTSAHCTNGNSKANCRSGNVNPNPLRIERRRRLLQRIREKWSSSSSIASSSIDEENPYDEDDDDCSSSSSSSSSSVTSNFPQDGAIHFELSVSFHDRTYDAVRSLARIRQLHRELVDSSDNEEEKEEVADLELGLQHCPSSSSKKTGLETISSDIPRSAGRPRSRRQCIPAFPEIFHERTNAIMNLRQLYAQLHQHYAPAIESWFRKVLAVITPRKRSTLTYFLCEPIQLQQEQEQQKQHPGLLQHNQASPVRRNKRGISGRSSRLAIIMEEEKVEEAEG